MTRLTPQTSGCSGCRTSTCSRAAIRRSAPARTSSRARPGSRVRPQSAAAACTKNWPPKTTSTATRPSSGTSSATSSPTTYAGTLARVTATTLPSRTSARAFTVPTAVSIVTSSTGPAGVRRPAATAPATAHIVLLPDMGVNPPCSSTTMPKSAPGVTGGSSSTAHSAG